jgi:putative SOS response-associated peptidase YedK
LDDRHHAEEISMCGRYTRARGALDYVVPLEVECDQRIPDRQRRWDFGAPSWNVAPGTEQPLIYPDGSVRRARWGYRPAWAEAKQLPPIINAKSEKLASTWKALVRRGRVIVPGDHWYEWLRSPDGGKQPYAIRRRDGAPLFIAGLCSIAADAEPREGDGFMIVTEAADVGLVDVHDRRPVVFDADVARDWLSEDTLPEAAIQFACRLSVPASEFDYFPVSRDVNRTGRGSADTARLVAPIEI